VVDPDVRIGELLSHERRDKAREAPDVHFDDEVRGFASGAARLKRIVRCGCDRELHETRFRLPPGLRLTLGNLSSVTRVVHESPCQRRQLQDLTWLDLVWVRQLIPVRVA
jgi:hypothetical protein